MRIISGLLKGRKITPPSGIKSRPTTDFAKEGLFNILNNEFEYEGKNILDLFAGTGSISFEFISRGVELVWCVEKDRKSAAFIQRFSEINQLENIKIIKANVFSFLRHCKINFDLIFADPPYAMPNLSELPDKIFRSNLLTEKGLVIIEHGPDTDFSKSLHFKFHRNYGNVNFSFFKLSE